MTSTLTTDKALHPCHAQKCDVEVGAGHVHVPAALVHGPAPAARGHQGSYRPGQEVDKQASSEYLALAQAAIEAVAHKESRGAPRKARPPRNPVQLALFVLDSA
jgi:hypothetical protein